MESKLLTTQDVAEYFGVKPAVVTSKFCREGLKYIRLSKTDFRYNKKDIEEFEEKMKVSNNVDDYIKLAEYKFGSKRCQLKV